MCIYPGLWFWKTNNVYFQFDHFLPLSTLAQNSSKRYSRALATMGIKIDKCQYVRTTQFQKFFLHAKKSLNYIFYLLPP